MGQEVEFPVNTEDVTQGMGIYTPDMTLVAQVQAMPGYTNALVHTFDKLGTYQILHGVLRHRPPTTWSMNLLYWRWHNG